MNVSGIVVACRPADLGTVGESLDALAWAEVHYTQPDGRMVVTIEGRDEDESMARLQQVQALSHVLMAEMAAYYVDPDPANGCAPGADTPNGAE